jgi:hypothetical protein
VSALLAVTAARTFFASAASSAAVRGLGERRGRCTDLEIKTASACVKLVPRRGPSLDELSAADRRQGRLGLEMAAGPAVRPISSIRPADDHGMAGMGRRSAPSQGAGWRGDEGLSAVPGEPDDANPGSGDPDVSWHDVLGALGAVGIVALGYGLLSGDWGFALRSVLGCLVGILVLAAVGHLRKAISRHRGARSGPDESAS